MRKRWIEALALSALLLSAALACGQTGGGAGDKKPAAKAKKPATTKSALEAVLSEALRNNPDLRVASARLQEAEAVLFRTRLLVVQKVVAAQRTVEQAQAAVKLASTDLERARRLYRTGSLTERVLRQTEVKLVQGKATLANAESELAYQLGKTPSAEAKADKRADADRQYRENVYFYYRRLGGAATARGYEENRLPPPALVRGAMADKLRKALDRKVSYKFSSAGPADVLRAFQKDNPGIHFKIAPGSAGERMTATLKDVPLRAALQLLEDSMNGCRFAVREYGLLLAPKDKIPPGAVLLDEFGKAGKGSGDKPAPKNGK
jgi:hypothetical protein